MNPSTLQMLVDDRSVGFRILVGFNLKVDRENLLAENPSLRQRDTS